MQLSVSLSALTLLVSVAGCATVSPQVTTEQQKEQAHRLVSWERECDSTGHAVPFWKRIVTCHWYPRLPLPPECMKPGTDDLPPCRAWVVQEDAAIQSDLQRGTMIGILGYDPSPY